MIQPIEEKLCNRMAGSSRCLNKLKLDKCPAMGKTPEEKRKKCVSTGKDVRV